MSGLGFRLPVKKADARCSCVTDHYECWFCRGPKLQRIWNNMTERQRDYDRYVAHAPDDGDYERSCSCHLSAPCSWCMDQPEPDEVANDSPTGAAQ